MLNSEIHKHCSIKRLPENLKRHYIIKGSSRSNLITLNFTEFSVSQGTGKYECNQGTFHTDVYHDKLNNSIMFYRNCAVVAKKNLQFYVRLNHKTPVHKTKQTDF